MNDNHLDPPDYPEIPECCDDEMEVDDQGNCKCLRCGHFIPATPDPTDEDIAFMMAGVPDRELSLTEPPEAPKKCPHGNEWHECDHCDYLADIAYDAARERR